MPATAGKQKCASTPFAGWYCYRTSFPIYSKLKESSRGNNMLYNFDLQRHSNVGVKELVVTRRKSLKSLHLTLQKYIVAWTKLLEIRLILQLFASMLEMVL